jgi:hypothetical protein
LLLPFAWRTHIGPDVIGPRRCPTWLSEWSKLRSDQHNNKAPDESGAVVMGSDRGDGGSGQVGEKPYKHSINKDPQS